MGPLTELHLLQGNTRCQSKEETPSPSPRSTEPRTAGKNLTSSHERLSIISIPEIADNKSVHLFTSTQATTPETPVEHHQPSQHLRHTSTLSLFVLLLLTQKQQTNSPS